MRTITLKLFNFEELSIEAQAVAKKNVEFDFYDVDLQDSARDAKKIYNRFKIGYIISENRLRTWIVNNILPELTSAKYYGTRYGKTAKFRVSKIFSEVDALNLTGISFDYDFLAPIMDFVKKPTFKVNNYDLARTDVSAIAQKIVDAEMDYFYSDKGFSEYCEDKNLEFLQNGVPFSSIVKDCAVISF